jgi:hypothetical protein
MRVHARASQALTHLGGYGKRCSRLAQNCGVVMASVSRAQKFRLGLWISWENNGSCLCGTQQPRQIVAAIRRPQGILRAERDARRARAREMFARVAGFPRSAEPGVRNRSLGFPRSAEPGVRNRSLQHPDRLAVDRGRHRKGYRSLPPWAMENRPRLQATELRRPAM